MSKSLKAAMKDWVNHKNLHRFDGESILHQNVERNAPHHPPVYKPESSFYSSWTGRFNPQRLAGKVVAVMIKRKPKRLLPATSWDELDHRPSLMK